MHDDAALEPLFNASHVDGVEWIGPWLHPWQWRVLGWRRLLSFDALLLAAYVPIGLLLMAVRLAVLLVLAVPMACLPPRTAADLLYFIRPFSVWLGGMQVVVKGAPAGYEPFHPPSDVLIACNHTTAFDIFPFMCMGFRPSVVLDKAFFESWVVIRAYLDALHAFRLPPVHTSRGDVRRALLAHLSHTSGAAAMPLVWFPEGWDTAGRAVLRYHRFLFSVGLSVVPVAMRVTVRGLPSILRPGVLGTSVMREALWMFFQPGRTYDLTYLPVIPGEVGCSDARSEELARIAQRATAAALGVPATSYTKRDVLNLRRHRLGLPPLHVIDKPKAA